MENVYPRFAKLVYKEIREILDNEIDGIRLIFNDQDFSDIQVFLFAQCSFVGNH